MNTWCIEMSWETYKFIHSCKIATSYSAYPFSRQTMVMVRKVGHIAIEVALPRTKRSDHFSSERAFARSVWSDGAIAFYIAKKHFLIIVSCEAILQGCLDSDPAFMPFLCPWVQESFFFPRPLHMLLLY